MLGAGVNSDATFFKTEAALSAFDDKKAADVRFGNNASMPSGQNFNMYWNEGRKDLVVVLNNGEQGNVRLMVEKGGQFDNDAAGKQAAKLAAVGAVLVPLSGLQETGFWNPAVVTDGKGEATLTITVPEQSTAWKLMARGSQRTHWRARRKRKSWPRRIYSAN